MDEQVETLLAAARVAEAVEPVAPSIPGERTAMVLAWLSPRLTAFAVGLAVASLLHLFG